jgi:hypothetical protein
LDLSTRLELADALDLPLQPDPRIFQHMRPHRFAEMFDDWRLGDYLDRAGRTFGFSGAIAFSMSVQRRMSGTNSSSLRIA